MPKQFGEDLILKPAHPHPLLGKQIKSLNDVVNIAENLKDQNDKAIVLYRASSVELRAIQEVPIGIFSTTKGATDYIRGRARDFGAREAFVIAYDPTNNANINKMLVAGS